MIEDEVLESFMKEFFPYKEMKRCGIFTKEMRGDYKAQAEYMRNHFGYKSIYEYGPHTNTYYNTNTNRHSNNRK
jgi:hypothetical protein